MAQRRPDRALVTAGDRMFWEWCGKHELRLQACMNCGEILWPVVKACEHCGRDALEWRRMSGRGQVVSWCTFDHDYYRGLLPVPYDTIMVELEEGPLFVSNPAGFTAEVIEFRKPVRLAFLTCEDAAGEFELPVFEADSGPRKALADVVVQSENQ